LCVEDSAHDLFLTRDGSALFVRVEKDVTLRDSKILFSFGSGDWADGLDAREAMSQVDGRWVSMQLTNLDSRMIIDKKACVPPFDKLDIVKASKVVSLGTVLDAFVQTGEIGLCMTHHTLVRDNGTYTITPKADPLCFVLDRLKLPADKKKKKKKADPKKKGGKKKGHGAAKEEPKDEDSDKDSDNDVNDKAVCVCVCPVVLPLWLCR
jgi:hypothetical protein